MKPLVSILIPAYNSAPWIAETIQSVLNQTWAAKELIVVVDDGSRDQTLAVARQFAAPNVSVVSRPHQGVAAARNEAYDLCQGEYIQWLDADDLLAPDKIARQMAVAETIASKRTLLSSPWAYFNYRTAKARFEPSALWYDLAPGEWLLRKMGDNLHMQPGTWLVRREIIEAAGRWDERVVVDEDGEYFCRLVLASDGIRFVPDARVFYRLSGSGSSVQRTLFKAPERWASFQLQLAHLRSLGDTGRVRQACVNFLQNWLVYFYPENPEIIREAEALAASLGGRLVMPRLRWKYAWMEKLWDFETAKRAQFMIPQFKAGIVRQWDKFMHDWEKRSRT